MAQRAEDAPARERTAVAEPSDSAGESAGSAGSAGARRGRGGHRGARGGRVVRGVQRRRRALNLLVGIAAVIVLADSVSKLFVVKALAGRAPVTLIPSVLDLELTRNPGAAFGTATGATFIFTAVALAVVVTIIVTVRRLNSPPWGVAFGLLLGGALGNLIDRIFRAPGPGRGWVVDWIHLHHWPVFNIADAAIVVGGVLMVLLSLRGVRLEGRKREAAADTDAADTGDAADSPERSKGAASSD